MEINRRNKLSHKPTPWGGVLSRITKGSLTRGAGRFTSVNLTEGFTNGLRLSHKPLRLANVAPVEYGSSLYRVRNHRVNSFEILTPGVECPTGHSRSLTGEAKRGLKPKFAIIISSFAIFLAITITILFPTANQVIGALNVSSLSQSTGPLAGGNEITIKGSGFMKGEKIKQVAADLHTLALTSTGKLYAWGDNEYGQLGLGTSDYDAHSTPQLVSPSNFDGQITSIAAGGSHSLALTSTGKLYAWGRNDAGQLGLGNTTNQSAPQLIDTSKFDGKITSIVAGAHTLALTSTGKLYAWGDNGNGQLGLGNTTNQSTPQLVDTSKLYGNITSIAAGSYHSLALTSTGQLYAWGDNQYGRLGLGTSDYGAHSTPQLVDTSNFDGKITSIVAGAHTLALTSTGKLYAWGDNGNGQLGLGNTTNQSTPQLVDTTKFDGQITLIAAAAGGSHSLALTSTGKLYAWGYNYYGELGLGNYDNQSAPQLVNFAKPNIASIKFGDVEVPSTDYTVTDDNTITINKVPAAANNTPGKVDVTIVDRDGVEHELKQAYLYTAVGLRLDGANPQLNLNPGESATANQTLTYNATTTNGYAITMSARGTDTNLVGGTSTSHTIPTSSTKPDTGLQTATWGYSTDGGNTYESIKPNTTPDALKEVPKQETNDINQTILITLGASITDTTPPDTYSQTIVYTITAEE